MHACLVWAALMRALEQVSDATIGGTYMTLLNTVANLGAKWPSTVVLALVDVVAVPGVLDGYHVLNLACTLAGVLWLLILHKRVALLVCPPSPAPPQRLSALPHAPALRAQCVVGTCDPSLSHFSFSSPCPPWQDELPMTAWLISPSPAPSTAHAGAGAGLDAGAASGLDALAPRPQEQEQEQLLHAGDDKV